MKPAKIAIKPRENSDEIRILVGDIRSGGWAILVLDKGDFSKSLSRGCFVPAMLSDPGDGPICHEDHLPDLQGQRPRPAP